MKPDTTVVILAGGMGTRLMPYTTVLPKPLMPVGDMPILEIVIRQLHYYGFCDLVISVGHLAELIMAFFGDGSKWGVSIRYSIEDRPLGTIGPLRLVGGLQKPFLVMNGDLLTDIDYFSFFQYHTKSHNIATIATATRQVQISLGVIEADANLRMVNFREKPTQLFNVSMGIYVFNPCIIDLIPEQHYGFDNLMADLLASGKSVAVYPFTGLWLDIGRREDYELASEELQRHSARFCPWESRIASEATDRLLLGH